MTYSKMFSHKSFYIIAVKILFLLYGCSNKYIKQNFLLYNNFILFN